MRGKTVYRRQGDDNGHGPPQFIFGPRGQKTPIIVKYVTEAPPPEPAKKQPTIGPEFGALLSVSIFLFYLFYQKLRD